MSSMDQVGRQQRPRFQALGRALSQFAGSLVREREADFEQEADRAPNSPDALDEILARASDPEIVDALVDG